MLILAFKKQLYKWGIWKQIPFWFYEYFVDKIPKKGRI